MKNAIRLMLACVALGACAKDKPAADSTAALPLDTVKPAPATAMMPDSMKKTDTPATKATKTTKSRIKTAGGSKTQSAADSTKILGRDSVIKVDLKDPKRQIPIVKKPPR